MLLEQQYRTIKEKLLWLREVSGLSGNLTVYYMDCVNHLAEGPPLKVGLPLPC